MTESANKSKAFSCPACGGTRCREAARRGDRAYLECRRCGLIFLEPREVNTDVYNSDYYAARAPGTDAELGDRNLFSWMLDRLDEAAPERGKLLDAGCGTAVLLEMARERGWEIAGAEVSPWAARRAADRLGISVRVSNLEDMPYPPESFDAIAAIEVIEHTPAPTVFLANTHKMLKKNGTLLLSTPNAGSIFRVIQGKEWFQLRPDEHLQLFRTDNLSMLLREAGFKNLKLYYKQFYSMGKALRIPAYLKGEPGEIIDAIGGSAARRGPLGSLKSALKNFVVKYPGRFLSDNITVVCRRD